MPDDGSHAIRRIVLERLSFIKYLYEKGVEMIKLPDPFCATAILLFDDAVELFLILAVLDVYNKRGENIDIRSLTLLPKYFEKLKEAGITLSYESNIINQLRKARNEFKHYGIRPSRKDIEAFKVIVELFFKENTKKIFDLDFSEISLADAIEADEIRKYIKKAEKSLWSGTLDIKNKIKSIKNIKLAYNIIQSRYINRIKEAVGLDIEPSLASVDLGDEHLVDKYSDLKSVFSDIDSNFNTTIEWVNECISEILLIFMLNIDPFKLCKFKNIINKVPLHRTVFDVLGIPQEEYLSRGLKSITKDDIKFCVDFIVDLAIEIQKRFHELKIDL